MTEEGREEKPEQGEQVVAQLEQERVPTEVEEKKQRFFQTVKCPMCETEISFEWEAINVLSTPQAEEDKGENEEIKE